MGSAAGKNPPHGSTPLREAAYREMLERAVEVLEHTWHAFRSKQLKLLRLEIEQILKHPCEIARFENENLTNPQQEDG